MAHVIPTTNSKEGTQRRRSSLVKNVLSLNLRPSSSTLDPVKFAELMSNDLTSGFDATCNSFNGVCSKAASILESRTCYVFLFDDKNCNLYTFLKDKEGKDTKLMKPIDRGITGFVLSEGKGLKLDDVQSATQWCAGIDEIDQCSTMTYLASPLWNIMAGTCLGVIEFRNKHNNGRNKCKFDTADEQMAQIIAFHIGRAVVHQRQQELLDGRNKAIHTAYEKGCDRNDSIHIDNDKENERRKREKDRPSLSSKSLSLRYAMRRQRSAMTSGPSWKCNPSSKHVSFADRDWSYDVFLHNEEQLVMHAVDIFDERGLFTNFSIPVTTFVNFVKEIKAGYNSSAPYHNHYHAFDVMHVCYLLIARCKADEYLDSFNIMSVLVGALAHDLGHDGFNNSFHCTTNSELAVVYNGISVLENFSAAYLFRILRKDKCNIFARLSDSDMAKMRSRLIDLILDTDAKNHFMLMTRFKHSIEMKELSRGLLSSMLLHVSDVSNPTRPGVIARKWAFAVQEEFFRQGDKEKELQVSTSPFMDRDLENLPRMQGAFIDALVSPVFNLLAELLPLVHTHCIKQLHLNRSFWNSMQKQNAITTEDVIGYLKGVREHVSSIGSTEDLVPNNGITGAIPGIPANAVKTYEHEKVRKFSLVNMEHQNVDINDLEQGSYIVEQESIQTKKACPPCFQGMRSRLAILLNTGPTQFLLLAATVIALIVNDLNVIVGSKKMDLLVDCVTLLLLLIFVVEMVVSIITVAGYAQFFLWLDLAASISLLLEIHFLMETTSTGELALAKASRAAKIGARTGRLAKLLRLLRLIKVAKVLKWMMGYSRKKLTNTEDTTDDNIGRKMSVVGRKMIESITKKVILTVLFMMIVLPLLETNHTVDGRRLQLEAIALNPESKLLREGFFRAHSNLIYLEGAGEKYADSDRIKGLRSSDILIMTANENKSVLASFDLSDETVLNAIFSLATTVIVTVLLAVLSLLFSSDAYNIMIRPIEKMKATVQKLSENPLLHLEILKNREDTLESSETDLLEQTITKMAFLLQVGFGIAGAEIVAKSLSAEGEVDPMVPGSRVHAIFGFCDIRNFTIATELLQEDVMLFVNKLAYITHKHVVESGGAPNKNIGDAFLLVWKLSSTKEGQRGKLQKHLFDSALCSLQSIIADIKAIGSLADLMHQERNETRDIRQLQKFKVDMGFGLHTGWAIEGSIGSKVKIDASYLSPHVNLASCLEAATKQYNVPLLMSDVFVSGLTGSIQSTCRRVDQVVFKGCLDPMTIFHQDIEPFYALQGKPKDYSEILIATSWEGKAEIDNLGIDLTEILKVLQSEKTLIIREIYEIAFNAYLDGEWGKCKVLFHLWLEKFPGDKIVQSLARFLMQHNFTCPHDWKGQRVLQTK